MNKLQMLSMLDEQVVQCTKCSDLVSNRSRTVFGTGNSDAKVMFIGEAPGQKEDEKGEPFVGPAGQLLTNILTACGWKREDVYIANICKCRPPGNRTPITEEATNCRPFLDLQIKVVNPKYIVCLGGCAAQNLLGVKTPISMLRGQVFNLNNRKVICTFHPSFLLHNPGRKPDVWEDMQFLIKTMVEDEQSAPAN